MGVLNEKRCNITPFSVKWNEPLICDIVNSNKKVPMAVVFGSDDTITPPYIGKMLNRTANIPCYIIENKSHSPMCGISEKMLRKIIKECKVSDDTFLCEKYKETIITFDLTKKIENI